MSIEERAVRVICTIYGFGPWKARKIVAALARNNLLAKDGAK